MKVILTEKQFRDYIKHLIESSIISESSINGNAISGLQKKMVKNISDLSKTNKEFGDVAKSIGVNPNYSAEERGKLNKHLGDNYKTDFKDEIINAARILSRYTGKFSMFDQDGQMKKDYPNEYNKLMRIREFLDSKGLTWLYNIDAEPSDDYKKYFGYNPQDTTIEQRLAHFNLDSIADLKKYYNIKNKDLEYAGEDQVKQDRENAPIKAKYSLLNNYMTKTYGLEVSLPEDVFTYGNQKLPKGTVIINFAAALQCPAWNECLLREACYARRGEKKNRGQRDANVKRNLMWEAGHKDPVIMEMIEQLLRLYSVDYNKAIPEIKRITGKSYTSTTLSKIKFSNFKDERILEVLKNNAIATHMRLNENGDFIGQWLLDKIDEIAGDFKLIGITTSAYTCRNIGMDYSKVANIILNVSNQSIKDNVSRYFFAVDSATYDAFDETYGGQNNALDIIDGNVQPNPQPLFNFEKGTGKIVPTGEYYYKCPCEREFDGAANNGKISCYECDICYHQNTVSDKPYYVIVKTHSNGENKVAGSHVGKSGIPAFGFSKHFLDNIKMPMVAESKELSRELLREAFSNSFKEGVMTVAKFCVNSIKQHLNNIAKQ